MGIVDFAAKIRRSWYRAKQACRAWVNGVTSLRTKSGVPPYLSPVPRKRIARKQILRRLLGRDAYSSLGSFDPLTPARLHGQSYDRYRAELQRALRLPKVRNIAVTGSYGAGKSSFIQSFAADHPEYNFCFVSLATFTQRDDENSSSAKGGKEKDSDPGGDANDNVEPIERIEASIVQQLLYSVEDRSIPQTRLKRINHVNVGVAALYSIFAVAIAAALIRILGLPASLVGLADTFPLAQILGAEPSTCIIVVIFAACVVAQRVLAFILGFRLQGITVKGLTLAHPSVASVLHKQLDEIVYLFERNTKDVVLIEDLDRFRDSSPFTRLREINFILNSTPSIRRPIHFVYMIRDDVFSATDRVKFFDYVIPIISVINTDNSKQKMLDMMSQRGWPVDDRPGVDLVEAVSYYVDDMRQLVNILNEYDLFRAIVSQQQKLNVDKMFSAVVTKCLFPRQYADLLRGRGDIHDLMRSYSNWSEERGRALKNSIAELEAKVSGNAFALANSERELRALIWMAAADRYPSESLEAITMPSGTKLKYAQFVASELVGSQTPQSDYFHLHYERETYAVPFHELAGQGSGSISARMASARGISEGAMQELSGMRQKLAAGRYAALSQAITDPEFVSHVAAVVNTRELGPVAYFIAHGLLGEDYFDYSGHFYAGSVSISDKSVMLRVKSGELVPVDTKVDSPKEVLKRLNIGDLGGGKGLISSVVQYLFSDQIVPDASALEQRAAVYSDASLHASRVSQILLDSISAGTVGAQVEHLLGHQPAALLASLQEGEPCAESPWREIIVGLILSEPGAAGRKLGSVSKDLVDIVEGLSDGDAFSTAIVNEALAKSWFAESGARIEQLQGEPSPVAAQILLRIGAPRLNLGNMLALTVRTRLEDGSSDDRFSLGSSLAATGDLKRWLLTDVDSLVSALLEQEGEISDSEEHVLWMLNEVGDAGLRVRAVERFRFEVSSIDKLDKSLWMPAARSLNIKATWGNLLKLMAETPADPLGGVVTSMLDSPDYLIALSSDVESLGVMDDQEVDYLLGKMLKLPEIDMRKMALFLRSSRALSFVSSDFDPELPDETVEALAETLTGDWTEWLLEKIAEVDHTVAVRYLASCANAPAFRQSVRHVPADLAGLAALEIEVPLDRSAFVSACFPRVDDWDEDSARRACWVLRELVLVDPAFVTDVLRAIDGSELLSVADVGSSSALLSVVVPMLQWSKVKVLLVTASGGTLLPLAEGQSLRVDEGRFHPDLMDALYARGVIRKVSRSNGQVILRPTAKF